MKANKLLVFLVSFGAFAATAEADLIHGTIKLGDAPLAKHEVKIVCGSKEYSTKTDERGSYSVKLDEKGSCTLSLTHQGQNLSYAVYSQDKPTRYDLVVVREDNQWKLRRK